jgi:hypothetical protein
MILQTGFLQSGGGSWIRPSLCMRNMATRQLMSFNPPSALYQSNILQVSLDSSAREREGSSSVKRRICAISPEVK